MLGIVAPSHDRPPSEDLLFRNDLRSLSTSREWKLLKLLWLPVAGFGGLLLLALAALVGLVTSELCELREALRENWGRDARWDMYIGWLRCRAGEPAAMKSLPGDVDKLGQSERELSDTFRLLQAPLWFEHSETRR